MSRRYTDDERTSAVAAVISNGGNVYKTAQELGIPITTLQRWTTGERHPEVRRMAYEKKEVLADVFERLAHKALEVSEKGMDRLGAKDAMITAATAVDKMRLLRGESTSNVAVRYDLSKLTDEQLDRLEQQIGELNHLVPMGTLSSVG